MLISRKKLASFTEIKVKVDPNKKIGFSEKEINIILTEDIEPQKLPYAEIYTPSKLNQIGAVRHNNCIIVARGDKRSPKEVIGMGGFHPQFTNPESKSKEGEEILDIASHRVTAQGSGVVSYTSDMNVAKDFGLNINQDGYVYLAKVTGAITDAARQLIAEKEYSVPGGTDAEDIVAFRKVDSAIPDIEDIDSNDSIDEIYGPDFGGTSIFISNDFIEKYPHVVDKIIDIYLQDNEVCLDRVPVIKNHSINLSQAAEEKEQKSMEVEQAK